MGTHPIFESDFDCLKGVKLKLRQAPSARWQHASCMMNGKLYVFGGVNDSRGETAFADLWRYEPQRNEWRRVTCTTTPMPKGGALMLPFEAANVSNRRHTPSTHSQCA